MRKYFSLEEDQYLFDISLYYHTEFFIQEVKNAISEKG
jgi:hypothetical protein